MADDTVQEKALGEGDSSYDGKLVKELISKRSVDLPVGHTTQKIIIDTRHARGIQMNGDWWQLTRRPL
jgi:hypothetical protein